MTPDELEAALKPLLLAISGLPALKLSDLHALEDLMKETLSLVADLKSLSAKLAEIESHHSAWEAGLKRLEEKLNILHKHVGSQPNPCRY